jgi:hypothetical protein
MMTIKKTACQGGSRRRWTVQTETLLHLTVGTVSLLDQRERDLARELLMAYKEQVVFVCYG